MGWCHAFGPQIREGCDHAMVAGRDSCSCAECGAVCHGLFPGCASVWAAGPRRVTVVKPGKEGGGLLPIPTPVAPPDAPVPQVLTTQSDLHALRVDMQVLMWKFDQLHQATPPAEQMVQAAKEIAAVAEALPVHLKEAVASALETQRLAAVAMFGEIEQRILADIARVQEQLVTATSGPEAGAPGPGASSSQEPPASVADLDARFQWLVEAVSERFVTLGNGLVRIERQLADDLDADAVNGAGADEHRAGRKGDGTVSVPGTNGRLAVNGAVTSRSAGPAGAEARP